MSFLFFAIKSQIIQSAKNIVAIEMSVPERTSDWICQVGPSSVK